MRNRTLVTTCLLFAVLLSGCALIRRAEPYIPNISGRNDKVDNFIEIMRVLANSTGGEENWGKNCLPVHLQYKLHDDWPGPLKKVPRWANAFCGDGPDWPAEITADRRKPIPPRGTKTWHWRDKNGQWRRYYAWTSKNGLHFREGFRWDDVDFYYNYIPPWLATLKFVPMQQ